MHILSIGLLLICFLLTQCGKPERDTIHQVSTISTLMEGGYDGTMSYRKLMTYGDFGLGTFNALDGEMVALEGQFYRVDTAGKASVVNSNMTCPFADVTFFNPDLTYAVQQGMTRDALLSYLKVLLPDTAGYYAIKVEGSFSNLRTRSIAAQHRPYPGLNEALAHQVEFHFRNISGVMVGYFMPSSEEGTTTTGFHFHFISSDRSTGGHVLDYAVDNALVEIDVCDSLRLLGN